MIFQSYSVVELVCPGFRWGLKSLCNFKLKNVYLCNKLKDDLKLKTSWKLN